MLDTTNDVNILRELARRYAEIAASPRQRELRELWTAHNSLERTRPPIILRMGLWNSWCGEMFGDDVLQCKTPFFREHERALRVQLFHAECGDDFIFEPWIDQRAVTIPGRAGPWGVPESWEETDQAGGARQIVPSIRQWADVANLSWAPHGFDEQATRDRVGRLQDAVGDILEVNEVRRPLWTGGSADISTSLGKLRGLEQMMLDMYESPEELHKLVAFMRDGILANQDAAEAAGDYGLADGWNQCITYSRELPAPKANVRGVKRKAIWGYAASQEFTLVSPAMYEEFLLNYQLPILSNFGLTAYGCCEDLTRKIDLLRKIPNLRIIAVTPVANVQRCCEQIGRDYVVSWRPNPADVICCGFDEARIRRIIREGMAAAAANDCAVHIHLKDIETLEGEPDRLKRWVQIVRDEVG